jgi:hypothetical protein
MERHEEILAKAEDMKARLESLEGRKAEEKPSEQAAISPLDRLAKGVIADFEARIAALEAAWQ